MCQAVGLNFIFPIAIGFPLLAAGESFFNPLEQWTLYRSEEGAYYGEDPAQRQYYFTSKAYQGWQLLGSIVNANGFSIRFLYTERGHLAQITDSQDRVMTLDNDPSGRILAIRLPHPLLEGQRFAVVRYYYDAQGRLIQAADALEQTNRFAYQGKLITSRTFQNGCTFTFEYDGQQRCTAALGPEGLYSYRFAYAKGYTKVTNAVGSTSTYYHRGDGLVHRIVNSLGAEQYFHYDDWNRLASERDALGRVSSYQYDEWGNQTQITKPGQGTIQMSYEGLLPLKAVLPNGGVWQWQYDEAGNLLESQDPLGQTTRYAYQQGLLSQITDAAGGCTRLKHTYAGNLEGVELPDGTQRRYAYDTLGRCTSSTDARGQFHQRSYDLLGRVEKVYGLENQLTELSYDGMGNLIKVKDSESQVVMRYNFFGEVVERTQGRTQLQFLYNAEGQLTGVLNEAHERYRFELDSEGQVVSETGFDGLTRRYTRNLGGQVEQVQGPDDRRTHYQYDLADRLVWVEHPDESWESYAYNPSGELVKAENPTQKIALERDLLGRVVKEQAGEHWVEYQYDATGNRTGIISSLGANLSQSFNPMGDVMAQQAGGWQASFERDVMGLETERLLPGGIQSQWKRDGWGRPLRHRVEGGGGLFSTTHRQQTYEWGLHHRLKALTDPLGGMMQFEHDALGNLTKTLFGDGQQQLRNPDKVGNLFESIDQKDRHYDKGGKLLQSKGATYKYDGEGNLIEKKDKDGKRWHYEWNGAGMLAKVTRPDQLSVTFGYDALERRVWKRVGNTITKWVWDGNKPLHEWKEHAITGAILSDTTVDSDGIITWLFEEDSFAPVAKLKGEKKYRIITDHLGTPAQMYTEDGKLCWQGALDSYGRMRMERGETGSCPFRYQGQYEDKEIGLYYNRFRYYSPEEGMYISQDPIRLAGGSKFYGYVHDPNAWIDPFGLTCQNVTYTHGSQGELLEVRAHVVRAELGTGTNTNASSRSQARTLGLATDDAGHGLAKGLGGEGGVGKVFPQSLNKNRGEYRVFEQDVADLVRVNGSADVHVTFLYNANSTRPHQIVYNASSGGTNISRTFDNP